MNFVKTHIYKQEYTDKGLKERIDEARREEEIAEAERLSKLPEFRLNHTKVSLAERLGIEPAYDDEDDDLNPLHIEQAPVVRYDEDDFYEELERQQKEAEKERQKQDAYIRNEFIKAKSKQEQLGIETQVNSGLYGETPVIQKNRVKANLDTSKISAVIQKKKSTNKTPFDLEGYDSD